MNPVRNTRLRTSGFHLGLLLSLFCLGAFAQTSEQILYQFSGGTDGANPVGPLVMDKSGNLYGVTQSGGTFGFGTIFELMPTSGGWMKTALYNFAGAPADGSYPNGGLSFDAVGNLYGVTANGGSNLNGANGCTSGCGTLYELSPNASGGWTETVLHSFAYTDGISPSGSPTFDAAGNIYGTTNTGGSSVYTPDGTVYEMSFSGSVWNYSVLYTFCGAYLCGNDGMFPNGGLVIDGGSNLYGTTLSGGGSDASGIVFELSPLTDGSWQETRLYTFQYYNESNGAHPDSPLIFDVTGNLYGATLQGVATTYCPGYQCGLIYELSPSGTTWNESVVYDFPGGPNGASLSPSGGGLAFDSAGNLYGATSNQSNADVVFQLARNSAGTWSENILHTFTGPDGNSPQAQIVIDKAGNLYGVAQGGGNTTCSGGCGLVFELTAQSQNIGPIGSNNPQATIAEPVSTGNGNYYYEHTDVMVPGRGLPFTFSRSYNALDTYSGPLGSNWTHTYNVFLTESGTSVFIKWGDGHTENYVSTAGGYLPAPGVNNQLVKNPDGSYTVTQKNQSKYNFTSVGKLSNILDKNGNALALVYDDNGNLIQISDTVARLFTLTYNANNQLITLKDPIGRLVSYAYSPSGDLATVTDPLNGLTTYSYDTAHHVTSIILPGNTLLLTNVYDSSGRVTSQTNGRKFATTFAYNTPGTGQTTITDPLGNTTVHTYDNLLRVIQITDALNGTVSYTYDGNNNRLTVTNQNGNTTNYTYDGMGNITSVTDALADKSSFAYDSLNDLLTSTNPRGNTTTFTYDTNGNLLTVQDALSDETSFGYDAYGELTSKTDGNGNKTSYGYDTKGNLTTVTDPLGHATKMGYDGISRLTSVMDANGHKMTSMYDALSRLTKTADPLGNTTQFKYSPVSNLTKVTDANGNATSYAYDQVSDLISVTDANGHVTKYVYDADNNRTAFTNANGRRTSYGFDKLNRLTTITDPLHFMTSYTFDGTGNVLSMMDANGHTTQYTYDFVNRVTATAYFDGTTVSYGYDPDGDRTTMVDARGATSYIYDALDRITNIGQPNGATVSYSYDALSHRLGLGYPDSKTISYAYDAVGRLATVTDWLNRAITYTYDPANRLLRTAYPNGAAIAFSYDAANRLSNVSNSYPATAIGPTGQFTSFTYSLDKVGNRLSLTDGNGNVTSYGYDLGYELISATNSLGATDYTYDSFGNRLTLTNTSGTTSYKYDADDRLLTAGTTSFSYDKNGNRLQEGIKGGQKLSFQYDAANRLIQVNGGTESSSFTYDGDGHRVTQTVGSGTYSYVNDVASSLPLVLEENGPDGLIDYDYGLGMISESSLNLDYFYHQDGLGSIVGLTDDTGTLQQGYIYDSWGNDAGENNYVGTANKFRYTGEALDPGTSLYFLRARYEDTSIGRFISKDAFAGFPSHPLTKNRYTYSTNAPTNFSDPSGLAPDSISTAPSYFNTWGITMNQESSTIQSPPNPPVLQGSQSNPPSKGFCTAYVQVPRGLDIFLDVIGIVTIVPDLKLGLFGETTQVLTPGEPFSPPNNSYAIPVSCTRVQA